MHVSGYNMSDNNAYAKTDQEFEGDIDVKAQKCDRL